MSRPEITVVHYPLPAAGGDARTGDVQRSLWEALLAGEAPLCACCGQTVGLYRRTITPAMATVLRLIAVEGSATPEGYVNVPQVLARQGTGVVVRGGEYGKLKFWGLIEPETTSEGSHSKVHVGWWRVTQRGKRFLAGETREYRYIWIYNDTYVGYDASQTVSFSDCAPLPDPPERSSHTGGTVAPPVPLSNP